MKSPDKFGEIIVRSVPERCHLREQGAFVSDLVQYMSEYRPCIVLDCSKLQTMEGAVIYLILCCLEEALKRNGDVRLAGVCPAALVVLESTGADRLFQIYPSSADAVESFHPRAALAYAAGTEIEIQVAESAA